MNLVKIHISPDLKVLNILSKEVTGCMGEDVVRTYVPMQILMTNQSHLILKIFHLQLVFGGGEMRVPEYASQLCHALAPDVKFSWRESKDGWNSTGSVSRDVESNLHDGAVAYSGSIDDLILLPLSCTRNAFNALHQLS